jgi:iron complex transport system substrate-binding protein
MRSALCVLLILLVGGYAGSSALSQISEVDDLGRTLTLAQPASRVISLTPGITESLFALGAGERVVGVTDYCTYPLEASSRPRVGGMVNPSIETIVGLNPDLILMSMEGNLRQDFTALTSLGIPVFVTNPRNLEGIYRSLRALGRLTGTTNHADAVVASMQARENAIRIHLPKKKQRVLLLVSIQPLIVAGKNTFLDELLTLAGGENLAAASALTYPTYSRETVVAQNPDAMVLVSDVVTNLEILTDIFPEWSRLTAVRRHRIYRVDADILSRPGPRSIDGLELLSSIIGKGHS